MNLGIIFSKKAALWALILSQPAMNFGRKVCFDYGMLILVNQGQRSRSKILENRPFLVIGLKSGYTEGRGGSDVVLLAACRLFLAACQML